MVQEVEGAGNREGGLWSHVWTLRATMNLWIVLIPSYISLVYSTDMLLPCSESASESSTVCISLSGLNGVTAGNRTLVVVAYQSINITYHSNFSGKNKEFRVSLRRGINIAKTVCEGSFNSSYQPFQCASDISCTIIPNNSSVTFNLVGLTEDHTDIYYFYKKDMYPPPYTCSKDNGTIIHVKTELVPPPEPQVSPPLWPLLVTLIVSAVYSIFITIVFLYILWKGRRTRIQQSDYINVVPRRPKNHQPYAPTPVHSRSR